MVRYLSMILMMAFVVSANAASEYSERQLNALKERIKPVGELCLEGDESCAGAKAATSTQARTGEQVFNTACTACHSMPIAKALGAPPTFDKSAWGKRLAKGLDKTLQNALNGLNTMPAKGNCLDCSDDEIKAAIKYMSKTE